MIDIDAGRIHVLKKKIRILTSELNKMQTDTQREIEHYQEAYSISTWASRELASLFPTVTSSALFGFSFESGVLIDDHVLFAELWNDAGLQFGKNVIYFKSEQDFMTEITHFKKTTFIYLDWYLNSHTNSLSFSRTLSEVYGFKNIIITTDDITLKQHYMPWIKAIVSKDPPWELGQLENNKLD